MWNWYHTEDMLRLAFGSLVVSGSLIVGCGNSDSSPPSNQAGASATAGASNATAGAPNGSAGRSGAVAGGGNVAGGSSNTAGGANVAGSGNAGGANVAGAGGAAGAGTGTAGSGTAGGSAAGASSACALCDDFEGVAAGMPPDPTKWTMVAPDCTDNPAVPSVDSSQHHGGTQSLKVAGVGDSCHNTMFGNTAALKAIGKVVYGRFYVRFETALPSGHVAFVTFPDATKGNDLRFGGQSLALEWNRQNGDATLPSQSPVGISMSVVPPAATWTCIEFMIDQSQGLINTWVNETLVPGLVADGTATPDVDTAWGQTYRPNLAGFNLGWQSFGGGAMNLWFDDVALSATRIHCL